MILRSMKFNIFVHIILILCSKKDAHEEKRSIDLNEIHIPSQSSMKKFTKSKAKYEHRDSSFKSTETYEINIPPISHSERKTKLIKGTEVHFKGDIIPPEKINIFPVRGTKKRLSRSGATYISFPVKDTKIKEPIVDKDLEVESKIESKVQLEDSEVGPDVEERVNLLVPSAERAVLPPGDEPPGLLQKDKYPRNPEYFFTPIRDYKPVLPPMSIPSNMDRNRYIEECDFFPICDPEPGIRGLSQNTTFPFLNSVLHALNACKSIKESIINLSHLDSPFIRELNKIFDFIDGKEPKDLKFDIITTALQKELENIIEKQTRLVETIQPYKQSSSECSTSESESSSSQSSTKSDKEDKDNSGKDDSTESSISGENPLEIPSEKGEESSGSSSEKGENLLDYVNYKLFSIKSFINILTNITGSPVKFRFPFTFSQIDESRCSKCQAIVLSPSSEHKDFMIIAYDMPMLQYALAKQLRSESGRVELQIEHPCFLEQETAAEIKQKTTKEKDESEKLSFHIFNTFIDMHRLPKVLLLYFETSGHSRSLPFSLIIGRIHTYTLVACLLHKEGVYSAVFKTKSGWHLASDKNIFMFDGPDRFITMNEDVYCMIYESMPQSNTKKIRKITKK